jgi:large subunit ribosomal protein L2
MAIKELKPFTSSSRGTVLVNYEGLWRGKPEKTLVKGKKSSSGRNNAGEITVRHKGGGHKRKYRIVDFRQSRIIKDHDTKAFIERIEYDPNRTAFIALIRYEGGELSYILAPEGLKKGDNISIGNNSEIATGNVMSLSHIPVGSVVHNIELKPGCGGQLARSAGSSAQVVGRDGIYTMISLPSGEKRLILSECCATIGVVSNLDNKNIKLGKAGRSRWLGIRPTVRGVAMNPVDHPHGGGEGKTSGGRHPVTPWGVPTKGKKTRNPNRYSNKYIRGIKK